MCASCTIIKNPRQKALVKSATVHFTKNPYENKPHKQDISTLLPKQLFEKTKNFFFFTIKSNPILLDSPVLKTALDNMLAQFTSNGYLNATAKYYLKSVRGKHHLLTLIYEIDPGPIFLLESVGAELLDDAKNAHFLNLVKEHDYLKPASPFNYKNINNLLTDIQEKMTKNGYLRFSKECIRVSIDTANVHLQNVPRSLRKSNTRSFQLYFYLDSACPANTLSVYHIKNIFIRNFGTGSSEVVDSIDEHTYYQDVQRQFHPNFIRRQILKNIINKQGSSDDINFIQSNFWNARSFSLITQFKQYTSDSTADVYFELSPRNKMSLGVHSDLSYNDGARLIANTSQNQIIDLSISSEFSIYNLTKRSIQYSLFLRGGIQLNPSTNFAISSHSVSITNNFRIPGLFVLGYYLPAFKKIFAPSTNFFIDVTYLNRVEFFHLYNLRLSNSYQWSLAKGYNFSFSPFNLEFYSFDLSKDFSTYLKNAPSDIQKFYRDGQVASMLLSASKRFQITPSLSMQIALGLEEAGMYGALFNSVLGANMLPKFFRQEVTLTVNKSFLSSTALAFRLYYGNNIYYAGNELQTPYFRKFFTGGAYSMRAWQPKTLGFGSTPASKNTTINELLGDVKLETNLEFRYNLFRLRLLKVEGAFFMDIGNVWAKGNVVALIDKRAEFNINRLINDLAIGGGFGLRLNFQEFIVRFDWSYRLKDPQKENTFRLNHSFFDGTLQIGIGYPF